MPIFSRRIARALLAISITTDSSVYQIVKTAAPDAAILEMKELGDNVFYGG